MKGRARFVLAALAVAGLSTIAVLGLGTVQRASSAPPPPPGGTCHLANGIKHVIYDPVRQHALPAGQPNVPSDLEQMPHLLNFIRSTARCSRTTTRS